MVTFKIHEHISNCKGICAETYQFNQRNFSLWAENSQIFIEISTFFKAQRNKMYTYDTNLSHQLTL